MTNVRMKTKTYLNLAAVLSLVLVAGCGSSGTSGLIANQTGNTGGFGGGGCIPIGQLLTFQGQNATVEPIQQSGYPMVRLVAGRIPSQYAGQVGGQSSTQMFVGGGGGNTLNARSVSSQDGTLSFSIQNLGAGQNQSGNLFGSNNQVFGSLNISPTTQNEIRYQSGSFIWNNAGNNQGFNGMNGPCAREVALVAYLDYYTGQVYGATVFLYIQQGMNQAQSESGFVLGFQNGY